MENLNDDIKDFKEIGLNLTNSSTIPQWHSSQLKYILHDLYTSSFLDACPGSGKTEVIGFKTAISIRDWKNKHNGLAVLSFTRNAAKEIENRIIKFTGHESIYPHYAGTIDSWLNSYILQPYGHSHPFIAFKGRDGDKRITLIDNDSSLPFLKNYSTFCTSLKRPVHVTEYTFNELMEIESVSLDIPLDKIKPDLYKLNSNKLNFLNAGYATYQDIEFISYTLLLHNPILCNVIAKRFPIIVIDECQDLSSNQLKLLTKLFEAGVKIHLIGDLWQSIYEFRRVSVHGIKKFIKESKLQVLNLNRNYRSNQDIVNLCNNLINSSSSIEGNPNINLLNCLVWEYGDNISDLPARFLNYVKSINLKISECAILARGKKTLYQLGYIPEIKYNSVELLTLALFYYNLSSNKDHDSRWEECWNMSHKLISRSLLNLAFDGRGSYNNLYFPDNIDKKAWRFFLVKALERLAIFYPINELKDINWSNWVKVLKIQLSNIWCEIPGVSKQWSEVSASIRAPHGKANSLVLKEHQLLGNSNGIRMTTIHDVKGETLEAVLLVSSPDMHSKGGHIKHWLSDKLEEEEYKRFAYVAASRPRHLLVIAVKSLKGIKSQCEELGLVYQASKPNHNKS